MPAAPPPPLDALVVGGGISGLTAAWHLQRAGWRIALLEGSDRVGGSIVTHAEDGWLFELGPNTVLENNPHIAPLIEGCGLAGDKLVANPAGKRRYVWKGRRLVPLPASPIDFLKTGLFSRAAKFRVAREPWVRARKETDDEESVADFVRRRLGQEMLDYAVGPFVSGVYAGDPERLSVRWAVSKIHALERDHGSLIRGALAKRKGPAPSSAMISLRGGLGALPRRLAADIDDVRLGCPVRRVLRQTGGLRVETDSESIAARQVVLAVPADVLAAILADAAPEPSRVFRTLPYAPVVVAALGYARGAVAHPLDGFGFLAPRRESLRVLGCLFPSSLFPDRAPPNHVTLTAFAGGRTDPEVTTWDDERVLDTVRRDLGRALGVTGEPELAVVRRWARAIPQYEVGHGRYVEAARSIEASLPGVHVGGNVVGGVSVADCVRNATLLAERLQRA